VNLRYEFIIFRQGGTVITELIVKCYVNLT